MDRKPMKSENRQRHKYASVRLSDAENELLDNLASGAGLSRAGFIRLQIFGHEGARTQRQPKSSDKAMASLSGQLGKIGGNLTQLNNLIKTANIHGLDKGLTDALLVEMQQIKEPISDMRASWLEALGKGY